MFYSSRLLAGRFRHIRGRIQIREIGRDITVSVSLTVCFAPLGSAPNYCGEFDNAGAMMSVDDTLMCSFQAWQSFLGFGFGLRVHRCASGGLASFGSATLPCLLRVTSGSVHVGRAAVTAWLQCHPSDDRLHVASQILKPAEKRQKLPDAAAGAASPRPPPPSPPAKKPRPSL